MHQIFIYMKSLYLLLICICINVLNTQSQSKLIASSTYHHDSTGYFINDSIAHFYKVANTTSANQLYEDAYVTVTQDSNYSYFKNGASLYLASRDVNTYNANYTLRTQYLGYLYDNLGVNTYLNKTNYYHTGLQLDSSIGTLTNVVTNNTYNYYNTFYHYNGNNQMDTTWIIYFSNVGVYASSIKQVNTYNGNNLIEVLQYESTDSVNYTPDSRTNYYYNANNTPDSVIVFQWLAANWYKAAKNEFTYNASNHKIKKEYFGFNNATQTYEKTARDEYVRNNNVQMDTLYSQLWNQANAKYDTTVKMGYKYQSGLLLHSYGFTKNINNQWQPNPYEAIRNYYYDMIPNAIQETKIDQSTLSFYPNPVENVLQFKQDCIGSKYYIITPDGKYVQSGLIDANNQVQMNLLPAGMYHIVVQGKEGIAQSHFIKM